MLPSDRPSAARGVIAGKLRVPNTETLPRERLLSLLAPIWRDGLGLVVAPAGSGKTSLLAAFARDAGVPVAWYRAESWDGAEATLVRHLEQGLTAALPGIPGGWETVEDAAAALEQWTGGRALLVIDDLHHLEGSPAEIALERLIDYVPPWLAILAGSRVQPGFNLSRRRVSGGLVEIGADELRFRSWEVERLFRDFYGAQIPPQELATLARHTEGWAAGLQLFHLASRGKSPEERRQLLAAVGRGSRLVREYLASNVLGGLEPEVRAFLLETCVLGRLSGRLCDALRGRTGSRAILEDLERRGVFTVRLDEEEGTYRYHEVLRGYLEWLLVDSLGEEPARERYRRGGEVLEAAGCAAEALNAYCRAEDWPSVHRLLGRDGERILGGPGPWLERLPAAIVRRDPWLILATARWARAEGRWASAVEAYGRAEAAFGRSPVANVCRSERLAVAAWLQAAPTPARDWSGLVRAAVLREPGAAGREAARLAVPEERGLVRGLGALLAGQVRDARRDLLDVAERPGLSVAQAATARLGAGVSMLLAGDPAGIATIERAVHEAETAALPWLANLGRAAALLTGASPVDDLDPDEGEDPWGVALSALATGIGGASAEDRLKAAERAEARFRRLGAGTLEAWARGLAALALAEIGSPEALDAGTAAEAVARSTGVPMLRVLGFLAMAQAGGPRSAEFASLAGTIAEEAGLASPAAVRAVTTGGTPATAHRDAVAARASAPAHVVVASTTSPEASSLEIRCFGPFTIRRNGRAIDLSAVKPRSRMLLHYLALHAGRTVHREVIQEALWPDADQSTAARSLQVGISTLRGLIEPGAGRGASQLIVREGEGYRLAADEKTFVDVPAFDAAMAAGRVSQARGEPDAAADAWRRALDLYRGDLLVEDGPAEWAVERREALRSKAAEAATALAGISLARGDAEAATRACRAGLAIDRYHDPLWRLLIESRERAGDSGAAIRARQEYELVLANLGVPARAIDRGLDVQVAIT